MPNPTVIATQLDSAELEKSIESLVQTFETKFNKIKEIVNTSIASVENRIMELGKAPINIKVIEGSTTTKGKGGASGNDKRTESLKREAQGVAAAVEQYDKLLGALQQATRQKQVWDNRGVENLNKKETRAYEQNLKRIIELQKQMRESSGNIWFARATANEQAARFDAKGALNSITAVDDRLKQLNASFKQMQAESRRLFNQELSDALKAPAKSLEQLREKLYNLSKLRVEGISREFITPAQLARVDEVYAKEKARLDNMRAVSTTQAQTHQQTVAAMTREEQIAKRIADQVRRSTEYQRTGTLEIFKSRTNRAAGVEVSRGAEERGYSLEEQILRIIRQRAEARAEENRRVNISLEQHRQMQQYEAQGLAAVGRRTQAQQAQSAAYTSWTNMVARVLGIQEKELLVVKDTTGSYEKMSAIVKQLSTAYNKLSADTRNSEFGRQLAEQINLYRRMMNEVQTKMSRPQSLASIKELPTNTLEQMRDKVQQLRLYMQGLNTATIQGRQEMRLTQQEIDKVTKKQRELLGVNEQLTRSNNTLSRAWTYMRNRLAFYLSVGASTSFVSNLIEVRGQYELTERALGVLIDSAEKGSEIFRELSQMALVSPYTLIELSQAARQLTAYGVEAENIVDTTRRLADIAAAVGAPISNIAYALGHVQSYGYLTSLQARQFANAGIPLVKALAEEYTKLEGRMVSVTDVYDRIKHKQVEYSDVMNVVNAMTDEGGRFFDFQAKTADTLKVQLANLTLAWNNMLNDIGKSNQGVLSGFIVTLKKIFVNWRNIENTILSILSTLASVKLAQVLYYTLVRKARLETALIAASGWKIRAMWNNAAAALTKMLTPMNMAVAIFTVIGVALAKMIYDYRDLIKENENFNKSIVDGTKENIESIDKFFKEYGKHLADIASANVSDQNKMWERLQEEIEKTTKNAQQFIDILKEIQNVPQRIRVGEQVLEQIKVIENEAKGLAERGLFSVGGGFADDEFAKDLQELTKRIYEATDAYGSFGEAIAATEPGALGIDTQRDKAMALRLQLGETEKEAQKFIAILDKADIGRIMGDNPETQLANIREFAHLIRANFLATEQGQKVTTEGQAILNYYLDAWIAKQGRLAELLSKEEEAITKRQTAWELFFDSLNKTDKERLDFLIRTNQTATDEFKRLWDKAAKSMEESAKTSYWLIQDQIAALRSTPDIVINVVYKERTEKETDKQRKAYTDRYIEPEKPSSMTLDLYEKQRAKNVRKYGRFIKKENEDNVEWEKRLGEQYQNNIKSIKSLNAQLSNRSELNKADRAAKEEELQQLNDEQEALKEIGKDQNFNFDQFKKGGKGGGSKKDFLGDALAEEVQLIGEVQKRFKEYRKMGVGSQEAITKATDEYGKSILNNNKVLEKFGFATLSSNKLATMPLQKIRDFYTEQLRIAQELKNTKGVEALEKAVASLNVEITKIDYKRITDGLNNELSKLKEDYELSVELYGNPELGDMFAQMFNLNTKALPRSFAEAYDKANEIAKQWLQEAKVEFEDFDLLGTLIEGDKDNLWRGLTMDSELVTKLKQQQKTWRDIFKKNLTETEKELDDYVKKYGERADKMAEIEAERLEKIKNLEAYMTEELRNRPDYIAKLNAINLGAFRSTKSLEFEDFKGSELYIKLFENLDYVSTTTLQNMRAKLQELKSEMGALTPTQLKEVTQQMEKLDEQLAKRDNPFVGLASGLRDYIRLLRNRGEMERKATVAQAELDSQQKTVDALAKQYEQLKRKEGVTKEELEQAAEELAIAKAILKGKKAQAQATADELSNRQKILKSIADNADAVAKWADTAKAAAQLTSKIAEDLGASEATKEIINDIGTILEGIGEVANGIKQLSSENPAEVVAGAISVLSGIWTTIAAWFDNSNKRITRQVEESERHVKRLQNAYEGLAYKVEKAMGTAETAARRAAIANKKQQLAELERQLALERSRKAKNQDEDKMIELEGSIASLKREINDDIEEVTNNLAGADIKSAAEAFVDAWVDAWREGETTLDAIEEKMDEMIFNIIKKSASAAIVGKILQPFYDALDEFTSDASESGAELTTGEMKQLATLANKLGIDINTALGEFYGNLESLGVISKTLGNKDLSALQQGIQGITEETANAIEAYLNGMSGQMYYHSTLLEQIRDAMTSLNGDTQLGVQAQMLLQLQQSYAVQTAIQGVLEGWSNANGMAVRVEMV